MSSLYTKNCNSSGTHFALFGSLRLLLIRPSHRDTASAVRTKRGAQWTPQLSVSDGDSTREVAGDDVLPEAFSDDDDDVFGRGGERAEMAFVLRDVQLESAGEAFDAEDVAGGGILEELQHTRPQILRRRFIMHIEKRLVRILLGDGLLQEADMSVAGGLQHLEIGILELIPWLREYIIRVAEAA